jgi:hypothetical protein
MMIRRIGKLPTPRSWTLRMSESGPVSGEPGEGAPPELGPRSSTADWWSIPDAWRNDEDLRAKLPELKKARADKIIDAELALQKEARANRLAAIRKEDEADYALWQKMHEKMADVAVGAIDRAKSGAEFLEKAAAALAGLYTGGVGLLLAADTPLPSRALIPTIFFGLAVVAAAYYLAYLTRPPQVRGETMTGIPSEDAPRRTALITRWARHSSMHRASALRAGVLSLALGLAFLPVGFVQFDSVRAVVGPVQPSPSPDGEASSAADPLGAIGAQAVPAESPIASPAPISRSPSPTWPAPTVFEPVELAQVLYQAQLEEFRAQLNDKPTTPGQSDGLEEAVAWALAIVAVVVVVLVWAGWIARPRED